MIAIQNISTTRYLGVFILMLVVTMILEYVGEYLWVNYQIHSGPQEILCMILAWTAVIGISALIPISAFRPRNRFSLRGDCKQRAKVFSLVVFSVVGLFVLHILAYAFAGR